MTERVMLLTAERRQSGSGGYKTVWVERGPYRAQLKSATGFGEINAAEVFGGQRAQFILRDNVPTAANMRLRHLGGLLYTIVAPPQRVRSLGMQTLICERVNE